MNGTGWLQIVNLLLVLGLMLGTVRAHQLGARRMLVMALAWICIFLIAVGIAGFIDERVHRAPTAGPTPDGDSNFT